VKLNLNDEHTIYKGEDGTVLTGVTSYLGILAKPSLLKWYASEERKGILNAVDESYKYVLDTMDGADAPSREITLPKGPFAELKRDNAADLGTVVHARVEGFLRGDMLEPDGIPDDIYDASEYAYLRFVNWWISNQFTIVESEKKMICEDFDMCYNFDLRYGGTADIIARDQNGRLTLIDLKTSNKSRFWPYPEIFAQVAAYAKAYWLSEDDHIERILIVRIGKDIKDEVQVVEVSEEQRDSGYDLFCGAVIAHEAKKALERMSKAK